MAALGFFCPVATTGGGDATGCGAVVFFAAVIGELAFGFVAPRLAGAGLDSACFAGDGLT